MQDFQLLPIWTKSKLNNTSEYMPDALDDNLIENNHEECSYFQMISGETMWRRKVRQIPQ